MKTLSALLLLGTSLFLSACFGGSEGKEESTPLLNSITEDASVSEDGSDASAADEVVPYSEGPTEMPPVVE